MTKQHILCLLLTVLFVSFIAGYLVGAGMPGGIFIPAEGDSAHIQTPLPTSPSPTQTVAAVAPSPTSTPAPTPAPTSAGYRINLNLATAEELTILPGIGEKLAANIIDYRNTNGPFQDPSDLLQVSGIGEKKFAAIKDYICVAEDGR